MKAAPCSHPVRLPTVDEDAPNTSSPRCHYCNLRNLKQLKLLWEAAYLERNKAKEMFNQTKRANRATKDDARLLEGSWQKASKLKKEILTLTVEVANHELSTEKTTEQGEKEEEDEEEFSMTTPTHWVPEKPARPAVEPRIKKTVSFAADEFDDEARPEKRGFWRSSPSYRPGAYGGKTYVDTSGYLEYASDFHAGTTLESRLRGQPGAYWPARMPSSGADSATYTTPAVVVTTEAGHSRTLVGARLPPPPEAVPWKFAEDRERETRRILTSPLTQAAVDRFLAGPKNDEQDAEDRESHIMAFVDEEKMAKAVFWKDGDVCIKTFDRKAARCSGIMGWMREIGEDVWNESVAKARSWEELKEEMKFYREMYPDISPRWS